MARETSGPATAIRNSAPADGNSPLKLATPPKSHSVTSPISIPSRPRLECVAELMSDQRDEEEGRRDDGHGRVGGAAEPGAALREDDDREREGDQDEDGQPAPVDADVHARDPAMEPQRGRDRSPLASRKEDRMPPLKLLASRSYPPTLCPLTPVLLQ